MSRKLALTAGLLLVSTAVSVAGDRPGQHFITAWDLNGDGVVSLEDAREQRANVFAMFDENDDGILDPAEFEVLAEHRAADAAQHGGGGRKHAQMGRGMGLEFNDGDGNGVVTLEEFLDGTARWFALIDSNGDGQITSDDFAP